MNWRAAALGAIGFSIGGWVLSLGQLLDKKPAPPLQFAQPETLGGGPLDECTWRKTSPGDCLWDGSRFRKPSGPPIKAMQVPNGARVDFGGGADHYAVTKLPDRIDFGAGSADYLSVTSDGLDGGKICLRAEVATNVVYGNGLLGTDGPLEFCFAR